MTVIHGIYTDGKIELLETPVGIREGNVRVILIEEPHARIAASQLQYGKYRSGTLSTEEDFTIAEWHGDDARGFGDGK